MELMCIDDKWEDVTPPGDGGVDRAPSFGEIVTVIDCVRINNEDWYSLQGYDPEDWFSEESFAPLSNIDEMEILKKRELVHG